MPRWVERGRIRSRLQGAEASPYWLGSCLVFEPVSPGDVLEIEFPMAESTEIYQNGWEGIQVPGWTEVTRPLLTDVQPDPFTYIVSTGQQRPETLTRYTCTFRGNTLVDIHPRQEGLGYPLYRRERFRQTAAPMVEVTRSVPGKLIRL